MGLKLDRMADSVSGQTVVDPKGYLTDLKVRVGFHTSRVHLTDLEVRGSDAHHCDSRKNSSPNRSPLCRWGLIPLFRRSNS